MKPATAERIAFLDHIRAVAILSVLAFHSLNPAFGVDELAWRGWWRVFGEVPKSFLPLAPCSFGWAGVAIFFAVSGFCIHLSHERSREKGFAVFFVRRVFRIYPPYVLALLLFALAIPHAKLAGTASENALQLGSHLLLAHNFFPQCAFTINGSFWSIATEFQLYLLYPLLLLMVRRWGWKGALWVTGVLEVGLRVVEFAWDFNPPVLIRVLPVFYWFSWAAGARLADDWLHDRPLFLGRVPGLVFVAPMVASFFFKPLFSFSFLFIALAATKWIGAWIEHPNPFLSRPGVVAETLRRIGLVSYGVYLLHQPFLYLVPDALRRLFPGTFLHPLLLYGLELAAAGLVCLFCGLYYRWVELPSIDLGKRVVKRFARPVGAAAESRV